MGGGGGAPRGGGGGGGSMGRSIREPTALPGELAPTSGTLWPCAYMHCR